MAIRFSIKVSLFGLFLLSCQGPVRFSGKEINASLRAGNTSWHVTTSSQDAGQLVSIQIKADRVQISMPADVGKDALVRKFAGDPNLYVLSRLGTDRLLVLDSQTLSRKNVIPLDAGSNPQDVIPFQGGLWVSLMGASGLVNWKDDRSTFKPVVAFDGRTFVHQPRFSALYTHGNSLWVARTALDANYRPTSEAGIHIFNWNSENGTLADERFIPTLRQNPSTLFRKWGSLVTIGEPGKINSSELNLDGAIEAFDPEQKQSTGIVIDEESLGGELNDFVFIDDSTGVAITSSPGSKLVVFDAKKSQVKQVLSSEEKFNMISMCLDEERRYIVVGNRDVYSPSIRIWDIDSLTEVGKIPLELPPLRVECGS